MFPCRLPPCCPVATPARDTIRLITETETASCPSSLSRPGTRSSENLMVTGTPACLVGDELPVALRVPLAYTASPFTNPGTGKMTLTLLPAN